MTGKARLSLAVTSMVGTIAAFIPASWSENEPSETWLELDARGPRCSFSVNSPLTVTPSAPPATAAEGDSIVGSTKTAASVLTQAARARGARARRRRYEGTRAA